VRCCPAFGRHCRTYLPPQAARRNTPPPRPATTNVKRVRARGDLVLMRGGWLTVHGPDDSFCRKLADHMFGKVGGSHESRSLVVDAPAIACDAQCMFQKGEPKHCDSVMNSVRMRSPACVSAAERACLRQYIMRCLNSNPEHATQLNEGDGEDD
jgi:hypothetical protein